MNIEQSELWWYLETRKFELAYTQALAYFERLIMFVTGTKIFVM